MTTSTFAPIGAALRGAIQSDWQHGNQAGATSDASLDWNSLAIEDRTRALLEPLLGPLERASLDGLRVADLGAGYGGMSLVLASFGAEVTAVDANATRLEVAAAVADRFGLHVRTVTSALEGLPAGLGPFDLAIASNVLCYLVAAGAREAALRGALAVLRPGGRLLVRDPNRSTVRDPFSGLCFGALPPPAAADAIARWRRRPRSRVRLVTRGGARRELRKAGFANVRPVPEVRRPLASLRAAAGSYHHVVGTRPARQPAAGVTRGPAHAARYPLGTRVRRRLPGHHRREILGLVADGAVAGYDLVAPGPECGETCRAMLDRWDAWLAGSFGGTLDAVRTVGVQRLAALGMDGVSPAALVMPARALAIMTLGEGGAPAHNSARRAASKARRLGYRTACFDFDAHLDDLHAIHASMPVRGGKPMPEAAMQRPQARGPAPLCPRHRRVTFGVLHDERVVAYAQLEAVGQLGLPEQFIGHGDHLRAGVMNLLFEDLRAELQGTSAARALSYRTLASTTASLERFKHSLGFRACAVVARVR